MTYPTTGTLDNFNRTNVNPLDGSWTNGFWGDRAFQIESNQVRGTGTNAQWSGARYNAATYGPDVEVYASFPTAPSGIYLHARVGGTDANPNSYTVFMNGATSYIERMDSGTETQLGASFSLSIADNERVGLEVIDTTITAYKYTSGAWSSVASRTDATYSSAGYIAVEMVESTSTRYMDDFGGGTVVTAGSTYTLTAAQAAFVLTATDATLKTAYGIKMRAVGAAATGTTSVTVSEPTGTVTDDVLVAIIVDRATTGSSTAPTGWTRRGGGAGTGGRAQIFTAVKGRNSLTGTSWSFTGLTTICMGRMIGYYNVNPTQVIDVAPSGRRNASTASGTTAITTATANAMVVAAFASVGNGATWSAEACATAPTLTEQADSANGTSLSLAIADGIKAATGTTGVSSATMSVTTNNIGILGALRKFLSYWLNAELSKFVMTGTAATLTKAAAQKTLTADLATFTLSGQAANLLNKQILSATQQTYTLTGQAVNLKHDHPLEATPVSFTLTRNAAGLLWKHVLPVTQATFSETGNAAGLLFGRKLLAAQASFAESGQAAGLLAGRHLDAGQAAFVETGNAAGLLFAHKLAAITGSYALTGQAAGLTKATPGAYSFAADGATFTITAQPAGLLAKHTMAAARGTFTFSGSGTSVLRGGRIAAAQATFTFSGQNALFAIAHKLTISSAAFDLVGNDAILTAEKIGYRLSVGRGSYVLIGIAGRFGRGIAQGQLLQSEDILGEANIYGTLRDREAILAAGPVGGALRQSEDLLAQSDFDGMLRAKENIL